jgi:hypothetical protein
MTNTASAPSPATTALPVAEALVAITRTGPAYTFAFDIAPDSPEGQAVAQAEADDLRAAVDVYALPYSIPFGAVPDRITDLPFVGTFRPQG